MNKVLIACLLIAGVVKTAGAESKPANPYDKLPPVPSFNVTSTDVKDGAAFGIAQFSGAFGVPGGKDASPQLTWTGAPKGTKSFVVTVFDPDAPIVSGFWHWAVVDIPASVTQLPTGAGAADGKLLPKGAWQMPNDARMPQFVGAAPPAGSGKHRYYIVVHALDVDTLKVPKDGTMAFLSFNMVGHTLGRATLLATAEVPAAKK